MGRRGRGAEEGERGRRREEDEEYESDVSRRFDERRLVTVSCGALSATVSAGDIAVWAAQGSEGIKEACSSCWSSQVEGSVS